MNRIFEVNSPAVVGEILDGEAVIMNLKSGNYFSTDKIGSFLWALIEKGTSDETMVRALTSHFEVDEDQISTAVNAFLNDLVTNELVRASESDGTAQFEVPKSEMAQLNGRSDFVAPVLNVYSDMQDLLLLDPIHDVDEGGWPSARQAEEDD